MEDNEPIAMDFRDFRFVKRIIFKRDGNFVITMQSLKCLYVNFIKKYILIQ